MHNFIISFAALLLNEGLHFDSTVTLGNIITAFVFILGGVAVWTKITLKIAQHDKWMEQHERTTLINEGITGRLEKAIVKLEVLMELSEKRLARLGNQ